MAEILKRPARIFIPEEFIITDWASLEPYYAQLENRLIASKADLELWLKHRSELDGLVAENLGWRYIRMTCDTSNKTFEADFIYFVENIEPQLAPCNDRLNRKLMDSDFVGELDASKYFIYLRAVKREIEIFREENIPLFVELNKLQQQYGSISGAMTVNIKGQEYTLQQAANFLKSTNRAEREEAYYKIAERRHQDSQVLDHLFDQLLKLRHQVAINAGFENFRDYMFAAMGRFDYSPQDCFNFHESIKTEIVPILNLLAKERMHALKLEKLKPWDLDVDPEGKPALMPFSTGKELTEKTIACLKKVNSYFGNCIETMQAMGHLDLESRIGKAPGGYNYPLPEIGVPFIFMNSAGNIRDLQTMVHEAGHAVHSFLTKDLELNAFKNTPSEVAELASMSMELISMSAWDSFFSDADELRRAKVDQLEGVLETLPWVAIVDKFQHWIYTHPSQTAEERTAAWLSILDEYALEGLDWQGQEKYRASSWHKQLHIFEVPFYYIEYGMAQLGAIAMWMNYVKDPIAGTENYIKALKLGYLKTIGEIYEAGGIRFDFSKAYVKTLASFITHELEKVK